MPTVPIERVYEQIAEFARDAGARRVVLFGSRARGTSQPRSDIDLAMEGCPDFDRLRDGLLARYGEMLRAPDATPDS